MKFRFLILLGLMTLLLSGCVSLAEDVTPPPNYVAPTPRPTAAPAWPETAPSAANGAVIFAEKCAACHGESGLGDGPQAAQLPNPPAALGTMNVAIQASPADWYTAVTKGNLESFMPPFNSLSDAERWDVVAYAFSLTTSADEIALGAELYQANCAECHAVDGAGETSSIDFTDQKTMSTRSAAALAEAIINGNNAEMKGYGEQFSDAEILALTEYIRAFTFDFAPAAEAPAATATLEPAAATPSTDAAETPLAEGTPVADEPAAAESAAAEGIGTISGAVINGSEGDLPAGLTVTLRGYDHDVDTGGFNESVTQETTVAADGSYLFENIEMPDQRAFVVIIESDGLTYASEPGFVTEGVTTLDLPVTYYQVSHDASPLSVDRLHIFFEFPEPGADYVQVIEVFVITNPTNYVIAPETEGQALLEFELPEGASNIQFEDSQFGERYTATANGFGDTAAVSPGIGQHQIVVFFEMPYNRKLSFTQPINQPIGSAIVMAPQGIKVKSDQLQPNGQRDAQGMTYDLYASQPLSVGENLTMNISGKVASQAVTTNANSTKNIIFGAAALGIVLIGAGVWLFKRDRDEDDYIDEDGETAAFDDADEIMDAIIALDDAYRAGDISEEVYKKRRAELKTQLKELV